MGICTPSTTPAKTTSAVLDLSKTTSAESCPTSNNEPTGATEFDGTNDYYERLAADFAGVTDTKVGLISFWVKINATGDGTNRGLFEFTLNKQYMYIDTSNFIRGVMWNPAGTIILNFHSNTAYVGSATWRHVLISWDNAVAAWNMYVDGVSVGLTTAQTNDVVDWTSNKFNIGKGTSLFFNGCLSKLYINTDEYLDITVAGNREKFRSSGGLAVPLGLDGKLPTGNQPVVYVTGEPANFGTNLGYGGSINDTIFGSPSVCSDFPTE